MNELSIEQAAAELLRRTRARTSLAEFALALDIPGVPVRATDPACEVFKPIESRIALHHLVMLSAIQKCVETPGGRLMLFFPPGSAKSTYASVVAPAWAMGRWPGHRIILTSYASDIATKQSRKCRALCSQPSYSTIFPQRPTLQTDQRAADEWRLTNASEFMSGGLLAGLTGNRANGVIIDDPISNREAADSPTICQKVYDEYINTALTRLLPGGYCILVQTRWSENDLAGNILPLDYKGQSGNVLCQDGKVWHVLNCPAKAEHEDDPLGRELGQYLWPEWFPKDHWANWELNPRAARTWSALYQQRPSPDTGLQFKRADARWYDPRKTQGEDDGLPQLLRKHGASDYAVTPDGGDFTEHGISGIDHRNRLYIVDWWSGQKESDKSIAAFIAMVRKHPGLSKWFNEGGVIDKAIGPAIRRAMREADAYVTIETLPSVQNKAIRLESFHARWAAGQVYLPINTPWAQRLVDQLVAFPAGKHDDAADVCGLFGRAIDQMGTISLPVAKLPDYLIPFTAKWIEWKDEAETLKVRYTSR